MLLPALSDVSAVRVLAPPADCYLTNAAEVNAADPSLGPGNCTSSGLADFEVRIGYYDLLQTPFPDWASTVLCDTFTGVAAPGTWVTLNCTTPQLGRSVIVTRRAGFTQPLGLALCEIQAIGQPNLSFGAPPPSPAPSNMGCFPISDAVRGCTSAGPGSDVGNPCTLAYDHNATTYWWVLRH